MEMQKFVDIADQLIHNEQYSDRVKFKTIFLTLLEQEEFDTFATMYVIAINMQLEACCQEFISKNEYASLAPKVTFDVMCGEKKKIEEWQKETKEKMLGYMATFIGWIDDYYSKSDKEEEFGFREFLSIVGRNLIYSAMMYHEKFERMWHIISIMFAIQYRSYYEREIKVEYHQEYYVANKFVKKRQIFIPKYYILVWDIMKRVSLYSSDTEYNYNRMKKSLSNIPIVYKHILEGDVLEPSKDRLEPRKEGNDNLFVVQVKLSVPFGKYLPSFSQKKSEYNDSIGKKGEVLYHPMIEMELPCYNIYLRENPKYYIEAVFQQAKNEALEEKLKKYVVKEKNSTYNKIKKKDVIGENQNTDEIAKQIIAEIEDIKLQMTSCELLSDFIDYSGVEKKEIKRTLQLHGFSTKMLDDNLSYKNKSMPKKDSLIILALILNLSEKEVDQLLNSAGYTLSCSIKRDCIIRYYINHKKYDIDKLNQLLSQFGEKKIEGRKRKSDT